MNEPRSLRTQIGGGDAQLLWGAATYRVSPGTSGHPGSLVCSCRPLPANTQVRLRCSSLHLPRKPVATGQRLIFSRTPGQPVLPETPSQQGPRTPRGSGQHWTGRVPGPWGGTSSPATPSLQLHPPSHSLMPWLGAFAPNSPFSGLSFPLWKMGSQGLARDVWAPTDQYTAVPFALGYSWPGPP